MDILITFLIVATIVGWEYMKIKKKMASEARKAAAKKKAFDDVEEYLKEEFSEEDFAWKNEKFETDSSKSESYFTYETVSDREESSADMTASSASESDRIHLQEVENEIETDTVDLHNPEELKKAIIYGEILKNPYN